MIDVFIDSCACKDIVPIFCGSEQCSKQQSFGPASRKYYLIHFCLSGCGVLKDKFGTHKIKAGELFIIRPEEITTYIADKNTPWEYAWISFNGDCANVFNTNRSVYSFPKEIGLKLWHLFIKKETEPTIYISLIYQLIYHLFSNNVNNNDVIVKLLHYIDLNFANDLSVEDISMQFCFEKSYLYKLFKKRVGFSIKEYIIKTRIEQAQILLQNGYSVSNSAFAVGYKDPFNFSKAFKKYCGYSPKEFREISKNINASQTKKPR